MIIIILIQAFHFVISIIGTISYDTGLEAPFALSLHSVHFCKFTPCCLLRLTLNSEPWVQFSKCRPTKLNWFLLVALQVLIINAYKV